MLIQFHELDYRGPLTKVWLPSSPSCSGFSPSSPIKYGLNFRSKWHRLAVGNVLTALPRGPCGPTGGSGGRCRGVHRTWEHQGPRAVHPGETKSCVFLLCCWTTPPHPIQKKGFTWFTIKKGSEKERKGGRVTYFDLKCVWTNTGKVEQQLTLDSRNNFNVIRYEYVLRKVWST